MDKQTLHQCPHLGLLNDPSTSHSFPSTWNACFYAKTPTVPSFEHQEGVCLTSEYVSCPVYQAAKGSAFPVNLRNKVKSPNSGRKSAWMFGVIAGGALLIVIVVAGLLLKSSANTSLPTPQGQIKVELRVTNTAAPKATSTIPLTSTPIPTQLLTATPSLEPPTAIFKPFALETTFKIGDQEFLIHAIQDGDGLEHLAKTYHTTPQVIRATNHALQVPIWAGSLILIRPDVISLDAGEMSFQLYQVPDKVLLIDELAKKFNVDLTDLKYYNNCADGCIISQGDWVLIPYHP